MKTRRLLVTAVQQGIDGLQIERRDVAQGDFERSGTQARIGNFGPDSVFERASSLGLITGEASPELHQRARMCFLDRHA
jgi:hypothetical protein